MSAPIVTRLQQAVSDVLPGESRALLAVSGGIDSMVLLHAATATRPAESVVVATFDHASGPHSAAAANLVERTAMSAGVPVVIGRGAPVERPTEAAWRDARLAFLRAAAAEHRAVLCTAHTRDDQVETVLFRVLRGAGARGLAGLATSGEARRPLLAFTRAEVVDYARAAGVEWIDDPSNADPAFARNRIRQEILPALRAIAPGLESELVGLGDRAAAWRSDLDAVIDERIDFHVDTEWGILEVGAAGFAGYSDDALGIIWPALLGRIGVAADWRGTRRLVAFTTRSKTGQRIQLSGGWTVYRRRGRFEVRRDSGPADE
jgi:tRNA(Ile)-lysidine synthase